MSVEVEIRVTVLADNVAAPVKVASQVIADLMDAEGEIDVGDSTSAGIIVSISIRR